MATVWSPAPYITKQEWLLADGSIVTSPEFETTTSGRRVRITGTATSAGNKQVNDLIIAAVDELAKAKGTARLLRIFPTEIEQGSRAGNCGVLADTFTNAAQLHINMDDSNHHNGMTTLLWDFECTTLPIGATVFLTLQQRYNNSTVAVKIAWRSTNPADDQSENPVNAFWDGSNVYLGSIYRHSDDFRNFETKIETNGGLLPGVDLKSASIVGQMRRTVSDFAVRAKQIDAFDEITLPDLSNVNNPFLTFKRKGSNYSAVIHNEILALVQTGPLLERIEKSYLDLVSAMKSLGVVTTGNALGESDFAKAAAGDLSTLKVQVTPSEDSNARNDGIDSMHSVTIDLATGSVIVNCAHQTSVNEIAEAWDIAKFKADVVGETEILLAYAQAYRDPKEQARIRKIINQRTTPDTL